MPPNKVYNWVLKEFDRNRWLVYSVAPPRNLNAFTLSFWLSTWKYPVNNEFDIACYASESQCGIHVSLLTDQRLLMKVNQARYVFFNATFQNDSLNGQFTFLNQFVLTTMYG